MSGTRARHTSETARQAKAWAFFNGSLNTIGGSFNVSSVTDAGATAGQYTVSFENNLDNTGYSVVSSSCLTNDGRVATVFPSTRTVSSINIFALPSYSTIAYVDVAGIDIAIFN